MPINSSLFKKLREDAKESCGKKQASLAYISSQTGISEGTLSRLERFPNTSPSVNVIKKLADYYGRPITDFIFD